MSGPAGSGWNAVYKKYDPERICNNHGNIFKTLTNIGIQAALNDLDSRAGWVYMPPVNIPISNKILFHTDAPDEGVTLFSHGGMVDTAHEFGCVLEVQGDVLNDDCIEFDQAVADNNKWNRLSNFAINGDKGAGGRSAGQGIDAARSSHCIFEDLVVYNCYEDGLRLGDATAGPYNRIIRGRYMNNGTAGIRLVNTEETHLIGVHTGSNIYGLYVTSNINQVTSFVSQYDQYGIYNSGERTKFSQVIIDKPDYHAIWLGNCSDVMLDNVLVIDPGNTVADMYSPFYLQQTSTNALRRIIIDNFELVTVAARSKYIFETSIANSAYFTDLVFGKRNLRAQSGVSNYGTGVFESYPSSGLVCHPVTIAAVGSSAQLNAISGTPQYLPLFGISTLSTVVGLARITVMPFNCIFNNLEARLEAAPGAGTTRIVTLILNGVATALTCTFGEADTTAEDKANVVLVNEGDRVEWSTSCTGAPAAAYVQIAATINDLRDVV